MELFDLNGQVALVTGGSRGLGKSMAEGLAQAGASILIGDVLNTDDAVDDLKNHTDNVVGMEVDVTDRNDVKAMVKKAQEDLGSLDILVNNAGVFRTDPAEDFSDKDWEDVLDVNLKGQYICAQEAGNVMIEQNSGKIINIASVAGLQAFSESVSYNASKGGVVMLTKTLAVEWGEYDVQVNAICPGSFKTDMTDDLLEDESFQQMIENQVPLKRVGQPEELAGTAVYLASGASSYTTGETIVVDGGWTAGL
jgi:NAD(P)-dependent dehydrogenase (short-subunit alcohol dehydrogenase family)